MLKPPLVLLPGWGFDAQVWQAVGSRLSQSYHLHYLNLPPLDQNVSCPWDTVITSILAAAPPQAYYLGWSLGGLVAIAIAATYPERVSQLATVAASPKFIADATWPGIDPQVFNQFKTNLHHDPNATLRRFMQLQCLPKQRNYYQQLRQYSLAPEPITLLNSLNLLTADYRTELPQLHCRQHHILGHQDALLPANTASAIQTIAPNASVVTLANAGHIPFISHSKQCLVYI